MNGFGRFQLFLAALLLALGVATAGFFVGNTMYNANVGINTAEVKGLAERRVQADRAYWKVGYAVAGSSAADVPRLYEQSETDQKKIIALLQESGFEASEITPGVLAYQMKEYRDENQKLIEEQHVLAGSIAVETTKVKRVAEVRSKLNMLIAQGLSIENNEPAYYFTQLNAIKPEMVQEATKNARIAANEFAANANVSVGGIRSAHQGGFTITDVGEEYGDTRSLEKDVRLVTTITFYLTE